MANNFDNATHSAYTRRGAVTPRNYAPNQRSADDIADYYTQRAMRSGKTVGDILHECLRARRMRDLLGLKGEM